MIGESAVRWLAAISATVAVLIVVVFGWQTAANVDTTPAPPSTIPGVAPVAPSDGAEGVQGPPGPAGPAERRALPVSEDCRVNPARLALLAVTVWMVLSVLATLLLVLLAHLAPPALQASTASRSWDPPVLPPSALPEHLGNGDRPDLPGLPV